MKLVDLYWLAGLIEGEGCFFREPASPWRIGVTLAMTDRDVVDRAAQLVGVGSVTTDCRSHRSETRKNIYQWRVFDQAAAASLMMTLYPLMGGRRQERIRECLSVWRNH